MHLRSHHQRPTSSQMSPPSSLAAAGSLSITSSPFGHHIAAQGSQGLSEGGAAETLDSESVHRRLCDNCRGHGMSAVNRVPRGVGPHSTLSFFQDTVRNNITTSVTAADAILAGAAPGVAAVRGSGGDVAEAMAAAATVSATVARDFKAHVLSLYQPCTRGTPGALCLYRGLRLRLGLHCCGVVRVAAVEQRPNRASGRVIYGGADLCLYGGPPNAVSAHPHISLLLAPLPIVFYLSFLASLHKRRYNYCSYLIPGELLLCAGTGRTHLLAALTFPHLPHVVVSPSLNKLCFAHHSPRGFCCTAAHPAR